MVVLHYTAMVDAQAALERLCDPAVEVSAHYLIGRDGKCWQLVDERKRAWHAGAGCWGGRADVNSHSIGIELDNDGASPFSEPLMAQLERLVPQILQRWQIPSERVIGHSDMAPGRKIDPGRRFDWQRLARQGLACWPTASAADEGAPAPEKAAPLGASDDSTFRESVRRLGYPEDAPLDALLDAFRSRFAQQAHGPLSPEDIALARHLAQRFPVDPALRDT
ncbi:N-acetylmuramoyl-L-alanine amidase [Pseudoruegeria sp. M32A2M]|nr:N-acetylmuramoyl-L-alanine amidase [Pseudoruegeria sp. M32A2M]